MSQARDIRVRVLAGDLLGAEAALPLNGPVSIGFEKDNDIVVRDASARGVRLRALVQPDQLAAALTIVEGTASLCGRELETGAQAQWPAYVPLRIGACAIAFGQAFSLRWVDAERLAETKNDDAPAKEEVGEEQGPAERRPIASQILDRSLLERARPFALGAAVVALVLAVVVLRPVANGASRDEAGAQAARTLLAREKIEQLSVEAGAGGEVIVRGYVEREADRLRIVSSLQTLNRPPVIQLRVGDDIARDVAEIFTSHGLGATTENFGDGIVMARVVGAPDAIAGVRQAALRDIAGLSELRVEALSPPPEAPPESGRDERIVGVVSGRSSFVVTASGRRYFVGSTLPSGHVIIAIDGQEVTVEREGQKSSLTF